MDGNQHSSGDVASDVAAVVTGLAAFFALIRKYPKIAGVLFLILSGAGYSLATGTDPRLVLAWANAPTMKPIQRDIALIKTVVIRLPGADSVLREIQIQQAMDSIEAERWGR